jgi:peroxiredoxin
MNRLLWVLTLGCVLPVGPWTVAGAAQQRTEKEALDELKKLNQPLDPARLKDLSPDDLKALVKKRAETALALAKSFETSFPNSSLLNEARSEALAVLRMAGDEAIVADTIKLAQALKSGAPKGSDYAAQAELYLLGRQLHDVLKDARSVEEFRAAWNKNVEAIRQKAVSYLEEYPKYRPGADAVAGLVRLADIAEDTETPRLVREAVAKNFPDHLQARILARQKAVGKEFDFAFTPAGSDRKTSLKDLRGKVVVVHFWASWCLPCRHELALLKERYEKHNKDGLEIVGVSLDEKDEAAEKFLKNHKVAWQQVVGEPARRLGEEWGIEHIPAEFVVDRKGRLRSADATGKLDELIVELLAEKE